MILSDTLTNEYQKALFVRYDAVFKKFHSFSTSEYSIQSVGNVQLVLKHIKSKCVLTCALHIRMHSINVLVHFGINYVFNITKGLIRCI